MGRIYRQDSYLYIQDEKFFFCVDTNGAHFNKTGIESEEAFDQYVEDHCK